VSSGILAMIFGSVGFCVMAVLPDSDYPNRGRVSVYENYAGGVVKKG
jgi:hypothetical protein